MTRLFVGLGRRAGLRPQDLVGAITGEAGLTNRDIGAIQITDRFSLVEVPESAADRVIAALQRSTIRGRRPTVSHWIPEQTPEALGAHILERISSGSPPT